METETKYLIYPPWARFPIPWDQLPRLCGNPSLWIDDVSLTRLREIGYKVSDDDHSFEAGLGGGGIICVHANVGRWLPFAILCQYADFKNPARFPGGMDIPVMVLVPRILTEHKLKIVPIPIAPSAIFSIELVDNACSEIIICVNAELDIQEQFLRRLRGWNILSELVFSPPRIVTDIYTQFRFKTSSSRWFGIKQQERTFEELFSKMLHSAMIFDESGINLVKTVHVFAPKGIGQRWSFSATRWPERIIGVKRPQDW